VQPELVDNFDFLTHAGERGGLDLLFTSGNEANNQAVRKAV
jgi:hypothetical protein